MKRVLKRTFAAALLLAAALAPAGAVESITRFISDVTVQRNGDLLVRESIQVRAEGKEIRRGILRDFPTTYRRTDGSRVEVGFDVQAVSRDGASETFTTERMANGVRVRIGRGDQFINTGLHNYVITYRTTRQIGFFKDFDELYWNATGTGWTFPIDYAEARITLPEGVAFKQSAIYTGPQGANGKDAVVAEQRPGTIVFRTTKPLPVRNGLTVAAAWQKGVVVEPTQMQQLGAMLQDEPALGYAGVGGLLIVLFYLLAWFVVGRDPSRGTIVPLFGPPDGMSAAAVRYVSQMGPDERAFTAAIVGLGVNGHLKVVDESGQKELRHLKGTRPLSVEEQALVKALFAKKSKVELDQSDHEPISDAKSELWSTLSKIYNGKLFSNNFWWSGAGFLAIAAVIGMIAATYFNSYGDNGPWMLVGTLLPLIPIMIGASMVRSGWPDGKMSRVLSGLLVIGIFVLIGLLILAHIAGVGPVILPAVAAYVLMPIGSLGFRWLQAPSRNGRRVMDQIEGFKQYLSVAEEDRLEFLNPPEKTPELFEKFLPYAIALDVQNAWAQKFVSVLAAAGAAAAVGAWYSGSSKITDNPTAFADRLSGNLSRTIASASTPPGSSGGSGSSSSGGSSGGGSSGGGGGGGGGSGW